MLVLSRKVGERILIGDRITVEVRRISGNRVTIALRAPRDVRILRGELEKAALEFDVECDADLPSNESNTPTEKSASLDADSLVSTQRSTPPLDALSTHDSGTHFVA